MPERMKYETRRLVFAWRASRRAHRAYCGTGVLLDSLLLKLGFVNVLDTYPAYYLIYGAAQVIAGLYLIRGAPFLVGVELPREDDDEEGAPEEKN
jgi:hypothetical protein